MGGDRGLQRGQPDGPKLDQLDPTVGRVVDPADQVGLDQPIDQPGQTAGGQRELIGELPHLEATGLGATELPRERIWRNTGPETLVLITCGGDFNPDINRYDDNIVVYAVPVG